ncbi:hypothetical protein [uncultured Dechloromonas sp.]|uniref:hypothetical protein n=1 Tax=uncultured Dechloromonas sp. TaxID=171719 RepID=UPI0025E749CB|nr:hypothetical protein [uncultured Dechloromonas sp.]
MHNPQSAPANASVDHLGDYVASVSQLHGKLAVIAANQRSSERSLGRAAAALRSIGALHRRSQDSASGNRSPILGNADKASR